MKAKTSVTISEELLKEIDNIQGKENNRSSFLEEAALYYLKLLKREKLNEEDIKKINKKARMLNIEAKKILNYQVPL
jgi:metal-responsive CopG/Arc/MetJ family transcriptional regulator